MVCGAPPFHSLSQQGQYDNMKLSIICEEVVFSGHAVRRMFQRNIDHKTVRQVIERGIIIEEYPDDEPLPS